MTVASVDGTTADVKKFARKTAKRPRSPRRPERHERRLAAAQARRQARKRARCPRGAGCVLGRFLKPLKQAVRDAIDGNQERRWFPTLSMLTMIFCGLLYHLFGLSSMRAAVEKANYLRGLGIVRICRSTFSDAMNSALRLRVLREVFQSLVRRFAEELPRQLSKFRHLAAIDSTILACAPSQLWAEYREELKACKAHLTFDVSSGIPSALVLSAARVHDRNYFERFLKKGWTYLLDRAYNVYSVFDDMIELGIFFVTRLKVGASYQVVGRRRVKRKHRKLGVIADEIIRLGAGAAEMTNNLRLVTFRTEQDEVLQFLTNRFDLAPTSVAALYRGRWAIELFFRFFKRTLRGARLLARSEVGAEIHVLLSLITDVLLKCLAKSLNGWRKLRQHVPATFMRLVRESLFDRWTKRIQTRLAAVLL